MKEFIIHIFKCTVTSGQFFILTNEQRTVKKPTWYSDSKDSSKENKFTFCLSLISARAVMALQQLPHLPSQQTESVHRVTRPRTLCCHWLPGHMCLGHLLCFGKRNLTPQQPKPPSCHLRAASGLALAACSHTGCRGLCGAAPPAAGPQPPAAGPEPAGLHLHGPACSALPP